MLSLKSWTFIIGWYPVTNCKVVKLTRNGAPAARHRSLRKSPPPCHSVGILAVGVRERASEDSTGECAETPGAGAWEATQFGMLTVRANGQRCRGWMCVWAPSRRHPVRGPVMDPPPRAGRLPVRTGPSRHPVSNYSPGPAPLGAARPSAPLDCQTC